MTFPFVDVRAGAGMPPEMVAGRATVVASDAGHAVDKGVVDIWTLKR